MTYQKDVWRYVKDRADIEAAAEKLLGSPHHRDYKSSWYLCPFHKEDTPSFVVTKQKRIAHCFGACGKTWNVLDLYAELKEITIPAAMEDVAALCSIDISSFLDADAKADGTFKQYIAVNASCAKRFAASLGKMYDGKLPIDYWFSRGLSFETINEMRLGFAPASISNGNFSAWLRSTFPDYPVEKFSLLDNRTGGCKFADRFTFPIRDCMGNIIGFGGRSLDSNASAKYLNTCANDWFSKGSLLYNFDRARRFHSVIIVEGYMDALSLIEAGVPNVAALMGTALTSDHLTLLEGKEIILCLDNDNAGKEAALKIIKDMNWIPFKVLTTPDPHKDVNDFLLAFGASETFRYYTRPKHRMDFVFDYHKERLNLADLTDRYTLARCVTEVLDYASLVEQDYYAKRLCRFLGIESRYKQIKDDIENGVVF